MSAGEYHMYLTQAPFMPPLMFRLATQQNESTRAVPGGEKTAFAWWVVGSMALPLLCPP